MAFNEYSRAFRNSLFSSTSRLDMLWYSDSAVKSLMPAPKPKTFSMTNGTVLFDIIENGKDTARNGIAAGETETFTRRLHLYVFKSNELWEKHEEAFRQKLMELKQLVEQGTTEFTAAARERIEKYLVCSRTGRGGRLRVSFNEDTCAEARKYFGYFVLVSNAPLEVFEALEDYRMRERIEELFQAEKENADGRRPRLWHPDALKGRMFVQFISLCYRCFIMKKIKAMKSALGKEDGLKTEKRLELERKLLNWLKQRSLAQIFDWFDCLEETTVKTPA